MTKSWRPAVTWFAVFNLVGVPLAGRLAWVVMSSLNANSAIVLAVAVSVLVAIGILGANIALTRWAVREDVPQTGARVMWLVTGLTFVLTIGTGFFSPLTLINALVTG